MLRLQLIQYWLSKIVNPGPEHMIMSPFNDGYGINLNIGKLLNSFQDGVLAFAEFIMSQQSLAGQE